MAGRAAGRKNVKKKAAPQLSLIEIAPMEAPGKLSKAKQIRDFWEQNPEMKPKDIVLALKNLGVETTAQVVSTTISNAKRKAGTAKAGSAAPRKNLNEKNKKPVAAADGGIIDNGFIQAVEFIKAVGGFAQAKRIIEQLETLKNL